MSLLSKLRDYLFDFSASEQGQKELEAILRTALAESDFDEQFERRARQLLSRGDAQQAQMRWAHLTKLMSEYRRVDEGTASLRVLGQRLLENLPHQYGK